MRRIVYTSFAGVAKAKPFAWIEVTLETEPRIGNAGTPPQFGLVTFAGKRSRGRTITSYHRPTDLWPIYENHEY
jgi:hypothetical protein